MNNFPLWNTLSRALVGAPYVPVGSYFFNLLAIEQVYHFPSFKLWHVVFTNKAVMLLEEQDTQAATLIESFKDAPFIAHDTVKYYPDDLEIPSSSGYFNIGTAIFFQLSGSHHLRIHLMSGAQVVVENSLAFQSQIESALTRARLAMPQNNNRGGRR